MSFLFIQKRHRYNSYLFLEEKPNILYVLLTLVSILASFFRSFFHIPVKVYIQHQKKVVGFVRRQWIANSFLPAKPFLSKFLARLFKRLNIPGLDDFRIYLICNSYGWMLFDRRLMKKGSAKLSILIFQSIQKDQ